MTEPSPRPAGTVELDAEHPWPGLPAYDEAGREFFHGRSAEALELLRLIRLAPLTVLYGKSGLGKSSLLQAGLFPLLRDNHYLPVYCRLDFSERATDDPLEQIAHRLQEAILGVSAECPARGPDEGLWEYLHRDDAEIWTRDNFPLTPVLVLDQFEELFSPSSGSGERIAHVFDDLADLIENRIPGALASDAATAKRARLELQSQRYRIVLSFREDYIPEVKAWERKVPSLLRNYLRLEPMTRRCAIEAVERAGATVIEAGAASAIVDFVGKLPATAQADQDRAVIEPALLSLFCHQLNLRRGARKIDEALIAGSGQDILDHFYREALEADDVKGPPDVAVFIETHLVQGERYRGSYPRVEALDAGFVSARQLEALTGPRHRLLRVVQYTDTARIELIHDCLVPVVCKAHHERKNREEQAELQRKADEAEARARERERYNRLLVRRNWLLVAFSVVAVALAGWASYQWMEATRTQKLATAYAAIGGSYRETRDTGLSTLLAVQGLSLAKELGDDSAERRAADQLRRKMNSPLLWTAHVGQEAQAVAFTPDSRRLVAASGEQLGVWDVAAEAEVPPKKPIHHDATIVDVAFTRDGTLVAADADGAVRLWDIESGDEKSPPVPIRHEPASSGGSDRLAAVVTGPRNLLATARTKGGSIILWDLATGKRIGVPFGQDGRHRWFSDLSISDDGRRLAAAEVSAGETTVWDISEEHVETPVELFTLRNWRLDLDPAENPGRMLVDSIAFGRHGTLIATGDRYNTVNLWNGDDGEHRGDALSGHTSPVRKIAFNREGSRFATASGDHTVAVWDTATRKRLLQLRGHKGTVQDVEFSPDGRLLATAGQDGTLKVWNAEAHADVVRGVAFDRDHRLLATASYDRTVRIWDADTRLLVARLDGRTGAVTRLAFGPDGTRLVSAGLDGTARLWDLPTKQELRTFRYRDAEHGYDKIYDVDYSLDGKWVATAGSNFNAVVWDAETGKQKFARRLGGMVWAVAFSPDGRFLASADDDGWLKIWEVPSGALVACRELRRKILDVNFSRDGEDLVMATGKSSVHLVEGWRRKLPPQGAGNTSDTIDRPCEGGLLLEPRSLALDESRIATAQFTLDGARIVTTGATRQVAIWDPSSGELLDEMRVHFGGKVNQVALGRDGSGKDWIATASDDGTFHVSLLDTGELKDQACHELAMKTLTPEQCEDYLGTDDCPDAPCAGHS